MVVTKVLEDPLTADFVDGVELNEEGQHDCKLVPHVPGFSSFLFVHLTVVDDP